MYFSASDSDDINCIKSPLPDTSVDVNHINEFIRQLANDSDVNSEYVSAYSSDGECDNQNWEDIFHSTSDENDNDAVSQVPKQSQVTLKAFAESAGQTNTEALKSTLNNKLSKKVNTLGVGKLSGISRKKHLKVLKSSRAKRMKKANLVGDRYRKIRKLKNFAEALQAINDLLMIIKETRQELRDYKLNNKKLRRRQRKLREAIMRKLLEYKSLKYKIWCYWCLKEATIFCCGKAAYCSENCQQSHWKMGHNMACIKRIGAPIQND